MPFLLKIVLFQSGEGVRTENWGDHPDLKTLLGFGALLFEECEYGAGKGGEKGRSFVYLFI